MSCSSQNCPKYICLLMLILLVTLNSIVVNKLCHRLEPNHSKRFYAEVLRIFPDYWTHNKWLKENGYSLLAKLEERAFSQQRTIRRN